MRAFILVLLLAGCAADPVPVASEASDYPPEMQAGPIGTEGMMEFEVPHAGN